MIRTIVAMLVLLGASGMASAQTPARVMTGYAATSGPHAVLWIAREAGLFDKNGIKAEVAYIRSGSTISTSSRLKSKTPSTSTPGSASA